MEVFYHFLFPYVLLTLFGVKPKHAIPLAALAVTPDLDVLFYVHRSLSHSVVVILFVFAAPLLYTWLRRRSLFRCVLCGFLSVASHPVFDMLGGYTPILWPIYDKSIAVSTQVQVMVNPTIHLEPSFNIFQTPTVFNHLTDWQALVFSGPAALMTALLSLYLLWSAVSYVPESGGNV